MHLGTFSGFNNELSTSPSIYQKKKKKTLLLFLKYKILLVRGRESYLANFFFFFENTKYF